MDFAEKMFALRKSSDLTQEQLAEKLNVSRQSVSKWESGQATPDLEKLIAMSQIFDVTTDYLLKPSEIDALSVKTEILEKQQQRLLNREKRQSRLIRCLLYSVAVYLLFFTVYFIGHFGRIPRCNGNCGIPLGEDLDEGKQRDKVRKAHRVIYGIKQDCP